MRSRRYLSSHCLIKHSYIYDFSLPIGISKVIGLSTIRVYTTSDYTIGIFKVIVLYAIRVFTTSDYHIGIC
jgi:hypothetical protein